MSAGDLHWEQLPEAVVEAFSERLHLVELLLDPLLPEADKQAERRRYQQQHGIGERTIRGYLQRYRKQGPRGLLFYRPRPTSPRVHDAALRAKLLQLINELPTRSVPQLRKLITADDKLGAGIARISDRTLYRFLADHGFTKSARYQLLADAERTSFRAFEAPHAMALVQADARDGIWLDTPNGRKKTYLFLWLDDFSRKILFGKYYFDEKLPALLDSFRYCLLRYGIPARVYVDGGKVYVSRHLLAILVELHIKHVRHPPYQAYCKGKIEAANKTIKNQFQREAQVAGMRTIDELNSAFWAWMELEYNTRLLAATGQSPDARFRDGLPADHRRITDLDACNALFLWRARRTVSKYGRIKLHGNQYPVTSVRHGTVVEVRFDPYDLAQLAIYDSSGVLIETTSASSQVTAQVPNVPAESAAKPAQVSAAARAYFTRLREQHHAALRDRTQTSFTRFQSADDDNKEHRDADA